MFKFLILFLLVLVFVPPVRQFFFWLIVGRQITKEQKRMNDIFEAQARQRKEGEVRVDPKPNQPNKSRESGGEYVDFKEIKD
jgi:UPF0716 family protein affecting phage T7 exclusion